MSNYKLTEVCTQLDRDPAGAGRSCIAGGHISLSVSQMISHVGALVPPGWLNACSCIQAPDAQRKAENCVCVCLATAVISPQASFFLQVVNGQQVSPAL